jgi:hypothetical protein
MAERDEGKREVREAERRLAEEARGDRDATTPRRAAAADGPPAGAPSPEESPGGRAPGRAGDEGSDVRALEVEHGLDRPPPVRRETGEPVPEPDPDDRR